MDKWLYLIAGGISGTFARYILAGAVYQRPGPAFPYGTLVVNLLGCFLKEKMAGATVLKGFMGFGCKSHMHTAKILRLSEDLPGVIEMVDTEEKINHFLPFLDEMVKEGLVTLEKVNVIMYRGQV